MTKKNTAAPRRRGKRSRKPSYAVPCMIAILIVAAGLSATGYALRGSLPSGLPQYDGAPDIALPMLLLQDSSPLREARELAEWEAEQAAQPEEARTAFAPMAEPRPEPAAEPPEPAVIEAQSTEAPVVEAQTVEMPAIEAQPTEAPVVEAQTVEMPAAEAQPEAPFAELFGTPGPGAEATPMPVLQGNIPWEAEATVPVPERIEDDRPVDEPLEPVAVDESYFDHTLFIGDSKTDGMRMWARLGDAHYFCGTSYSVYNIGKKKSTDKAFKNASLADVLRKYQYDQIYIILGYNESGYPYENLMKQFEYVISNVHKAQPQARIILHGVMHASQRVSKKYSYYSPKNLEKINDGLRAMADEWDGMYYVDCNPAFCDENGYLLSKVTNDGEHLTPDYTRQWAQEILARAIVP